MTKLLNITDLLGLFNCTRNTLKKHRTLPDFPKSVDLDGNPRWRETDICAWIASR
jgi:predicted DNA-binding transcriptional regulator AlpA